LLCFVLMRSTTLGCFRLRSWCLWKALDEEGGAWAWFHDIWTCSAKVLEYWMIFSLKIKLSRSWNFWRNWNVPWVLLERSWWTGFNEVYLIKFGFRMWEILIFQWFIYAVENSNKFQKNQVLEGKISWGRDNTWRLKIQFKHDFLSYLAAQKIDTYIAKQCSHVEFPYFL
jgi:hypothetical protein